MSNDASDLGLHLRRMLVAAAAIPIEAAELTAPILARNIREAMGTDQLQDLAESTQIERARMGFTPNDPLVRTGELRDSVLPFVEGSTAIAASSDPRSRWQEFGTNVIPPRPAFQIGHGETLPEALAIARGLVREKLGKE